MLECWWKHEYIAAKAQRTENNGKDIIAQSHNAFICKYHDQGNSPFIIERVAQFIVNGTVPAAQRKAWLKHLLRLTSSIMWLSQNV